MQTVEDDVKPFDENEDDMEIISDLFREIDDTGNGLLSMEELQMALAKFEGNEMAKVLMDLMKQNSQKNIDMHTFTQFVLKIPRIRGERVRWAGTLKLDAYLARFLPKGDIFDGLKSLRTVQDHELEGLIQECCRKFSADLPRILRNGLKALRASEEGTSVVQQHINTKFVMDQAYIGQFATLTDFYNGPEALIGVPNPRIYVGAEKEHNFRENAYEKFNTSNYNIDTYPALEWEFVVSPKADGDYPHTPRDKNKWKQGNAWRGEHGRDVISLQAFMCDETAKPYLEKAELRREEVICLRLYTGPMFVLYNASLRKFPSWDVEHLKGNQYETTIFVIASGITKLSKVTGIPADRKLYRGLGGMVLPDHFWKNFEESQISFAATFATAEAAAAARISLNEHVSEAKTGVLASKHTLGVKFLDIQRFWDAFDWPGGRSARVVRPAAVSEGTVSMAVALSMSKFDFRGRHQLFKEAVLACFSPSGQEPPPEITLQEIADKPFDFKGGVEFGLMSTTSARDTAIQYSGVSRDRGIVFEIQAGRVDVGASIQFLSQYPGEAEFLMPPLSCLEVMGDPRVDRSAKGEIVVIPLRVNVNLKACTVEDLIKRRKDLQSAMTKNLREELNHGADAQVDRFEDIMKLRRKGVVEVLRGDVSKVAIENMFFVKFNDSDIATVAAPFLGFTSGKIYYEVELTSSGTGGWIKAGWAGTNVSSEPEIYLSGDDSGVFWGICSETHREAWKQPGSGGWMHAGATLCIAADLDAGSVKAALTRADHQPSAWIDIKSQGVHPSATTGSNLFPAISGKGGIGIKYNFGSAGQMIHTPPSPDFKTVTEAANLLVQDEFHSSKSDKEILDMLVRLNVDAKSLLHEFDSITEAHVLMEADVFNDDQIYKSCLNQALDTKVGVARKQDIVMTMLKEGASEVQLRVFRKAPATDFLENKKLESECRFTWRSLLSGNQDYLKYVKHVHIPLEIPPPQIALIWEIAMEFCRTKNVQVKIGAEMHFMGDLIPKLHLKHRRLDAGKYGGAVLGLLLAYKNFHASSKPVASSNLNSGSSIEVVIPTPISQPQPQPAQLQPLQSNEEQNKSSSHGNEPSGSCACWPNVNSKQKEEARTKGSASDEDKALASTTISATNTDDGGSGKEAKGLFRGMDVDLRGNDFSRTRRIQIVDAIIECHKEKSLRAVNGLEVTNAQESNLRDCVHRNGGIDEEITGLGKSLDTVDWGFVMYQVGSYRWEALDLSCNAIDQQAALDVCRGLASASFLAQLDLGSNDFHTQGGTALSNILGRLLHLKELDLRSNELGVDGGAAIAGCLTKLTKMRRLNLSANLFGVPGGVVIAESLAFLTDLSELNLSSNDLQEQGATCLGKSLCFLENLTALNISAFRTLDTELNQRRSNGIGAEGAAILAGSLNPKLITLNLGKNGIGPGGGSVLGDKVSIKAGNEIGNNSNHPATKGLARFSSLKTLQLQGNQLHDSGVAGISQSFACLKDLTFLDFEDNCISDLGVKAIFQSLPQLANLEALFLNKNSIKCSDGAASEIVAAVAQMTALQTLWLDNNEVGDDGKKAIRASLGSQVTGLRV